MGYRCCGKTFGNIQELNEHTAQSHHRLLKPSELGEVLVCESCGLTSRVCMQPIHAAGMSEPGDRLERDPLTSIRMFVS